MELRFKCKGRKSEHRSRKLVGIQHVDHLDRPFEFRTQANSVETNQRFCDRNSMGRSFSPIKTVPQASVSTD
jgi:hypothetical protein